MSHYHFGWWIRPFISVYNPSYFLLLEPCIKASPAGSCTGNDLMEQQICQYNTITNFSLVDLWHLFLTNLHTYVETALYEKRMKLFSHEHLWYNQIPWKRVQILSNMNNSLQYIAKKQIKYDFYQFIQFISVSVFSPHSLSSTIILSMLNSD